MSKGLYLVSNHSFKEQVNHSLFSLNEMIDSGYSYTDLEKYFQNWWFDLADINPYEKVFYLEEKNEFTFEIIQDTDPQTISKYTHQKYYYEVRITNPTSFYSDLVSYLNNYSIPYEIWCIWEGEFDPDNLEVFDICNLSEKDLKNLIEDDTYLNPKVGKIWC